MLEGHLPRGHSRRARRSKLDACGSVRTTARALPNAGLTGQGLTSLISIFMLIAIVRALSQPDLPRSNVTNPDVDSAPFLSFLMKSLGLLSK